MTHEIDKPKNASPTAEDLLDAELADPDGCERGFLSVRALVVYTETQEAILLRYSEGGKT